MFPAFSLEDADGSTGSSAGVPPHAFQRDNPRRKEIEMKEKTRVEPHIEQEFFRPAQAARFLAVSRRFVGHLTAVGILKAHRIGKRCVRYSRADLLDTMNSFRR